jgi:hypothetical protein
MDELQEATESVYRQFSRYPRPTAIEFCPCGCTKPEEVVPLLAYPLREIPFNELDNYAFSAITTQGNEKDFCYFLPRLLERLSCASSLTSPQIIFGKVTLQYCPNLSEDDRDVIGQWLDALWRTALASLPIQSRLPDFFSMEDILICVALTGRHLDAYLQTWTRTETQIADQHLVQLVTDCGANLADGGAIEGSGWKYSASQRAAIRRWILSEATMNRILASSGLPKEEGTELNFEHALDILKRESRWYLRTPRPTESPAPPHAPLTLPPDQ